MRTNAILAGLALMLGLAAPVAAVAAEPPDMSPAADEGTGSGGNRPGMHAPGHHGGWQRHMGEGGRSHGHHRPSFIGMLLRNRQQLGPWRPKYWVLLCRSVALKCMIFRYSCSSYSIAVLERPRTI